MKTELNPDALMAALENTQGNILKVKRKLAAMGIEANWHTIERSLSKPEERFAYLVESAPTAAKRGEVKRKLAALNAKYLEEKETMLDVAESNLMEALVNKEQWATKYALSTKGKARGYDMTAAIRLESDDPLNINLSGDAMTAEELSASSGVEVSGGGENGGQ